MKAKIIVNGHEHEVDAERVSYEDVVRLAGMSGTPSMTLRHTDPGARSAILFPGESLLAATVDGCIFNVAHTGNA